MTAIRWFNLVAVTSILLISQSDFAECGMLQASQPSGAEQTGQRHFSLSPTVWLDAEGEPLPFQSDAEILHFLWTAEVVSMEKIPVGVTHPQKVLLEKDGIRLHASFRDVDIYKRYWESPSKGVRVNFRDNYLYECAAYRLARLLGIRNVPPVVPREIKGKKGALQVWVEDAMMERDRADKTIIPPDTWRWSMQLQVKELFDNLIFNDDRNQGNLLIDEHWKLWLIDHTRAFRTFSKLPDAEVIKFVEKGIWEKLKNLDETVLTEQLSEFLSEAELKGLLRRRDALIAHIEKVLQERGEKRVFFTFSEAKRAEIALR